MGQMMLTIGALILLGTVIYGVNSTIVNQQGWSIGTEAFMTGTAIGQALIEQITVKRFDDDWIAPLLCPDPSQLVPNSSLGKDLDEVVETSFDDIDDYNNFEKTVKTDRLGNFDLTCKVYYIDEITYAKKTTQTFYKQIDVIVKNQFIPSSDTAHSITISTISAYRLR